MRPEPRDRMSSFLQAEEQSGILFDSDLPGEGRAVLMGFVVVSEWMDENGERWLARLGGGGNGPAATWQLQGYLHNALHDRWPE